MFDFIKGIFNVQQRNVLFISDSITYMALHQKENHHQSYVFFSTGINSSPLLVMAHFVHGAF